MTDPTLSEIKDAIAYYEARGYDWLGVVGYLSAKALGTLPDDVRAAYLKRKDQR